MNNRKEKIDFLKGLMTGKRKLSELQPLQDYFFVKDKDTQLYYGKEPYTVLTEKEVKELERENPNSLFFIVSTSPELRELILNL